MLFKTYKDNVLENNINIDPTTIEQYERYFKAVENNFLNDDFTYNEPITKNDKSKSPKLK